MNELGSSKIPFLFIINFDISEGMVLPLNEVDKKEILFDFEGKRNDNDIQIERRHLFKGDLENSIVLFPIPEADYKIAFDKVLKHINFGDSYLANLTFRTKIETNINLHEFYLIANSRFKLMVKDRFVSFSPEPFVKIENGIISSYPMKGTISAEIPNAEQILLEDTKEIAEHFTIVDLLRNDLSIVSKQVRVEKFRYAEEIRTSKGSILQTSSKISGKLEEGWENNVGTIITSMLPAGSVTGAPKKKTVEIIKEVENYERGFYTGIAGIYDGTNLTSCVLIRFIEQTDSGLYFKTGGGITSKSDCTKEYQEMLEKIYVPTI
jgi:para-aminobenzoate synthetase component 1